MFRYFAVACAVLAGCASESLDKSQSGQLSAWTKPGIDASQTLMDAFECCPSRSVRVHGWGAVPWGGGTTGWGDSCMASRGYSLTQVRWAHASKLDFSSDYSECSTWGYDEAIEYLGCRNPATNAAWGAMAPACQKAVVRLQAGVSDSPGWSWEADPTSRFRLCMASKGYTTVPIDG